MTTGGVDDWDKRFPVAEGLRPGIAQLQDLCTSFSSQLLVAAAAAAAADKPPVPSSSKGNPQLQHLRSSPQLSARRNASLRNLAVLSRAASPHLRPAAEARSGLEGTMPGSNEGEAVGAMETPAQFLEWYGQVEGQLAAGQDAESHMYASQLRERKAACWQMLESVRGVQQLLSEMEADHRRLCQQTEGVESACAALGARRGRLDRVAGEIGDQLRVYNWLGPITRLLHGPGDRVCEDHEFLASLDRAEEAIRFIGERAEEAKDSELYLMRFAQYRMRALSLIKMHALRTFKALGSVDNRGRVAAYVQFRAAAVALGPLIGALKRRATEPTERQVLADVQAAYFATRQAWLRPYVQKRLREIAAEHEVGETGLLEARVGALRDWCAFLMAVSADETALYCDFFGDSSGGEEEPLLRAFLDSLMTLFHDQVRPLVIRESDVAVLAGLSLTLLTYRRPGDDDDQEEEEEEGGEEEGERGESEEAVDNDGLDAFYSVIAHVLHDTQHRLAYKAQSFMRTAIGGYRITAPDSEAMARWVHACQRLRITDPAQLSALLLSEEGEECLRWVYPPIESCRWLVAQIDGCLDYEVQCGLVDEARTACKQNLLSIGARFVRDSSIKSEENPITEADAELIAHLFATHNLAAIDLDPS
ncbi:Golgi transport complex subunit 3 [Coemansia aciculifera]|uniref:Golgi transport complex subunit 3 n=1 Tax=Coemansia aciculifera TaxID=417176 RepID=A0ACC1M0P6_9FUNG|nr:Golgi transport complex subunit 3 [Coemansia aciculifera]